MIDPSHRPCSEMLASIRNGNGRKGPGSKDQLKIFENK